MLPALKPVYTPFIRARSTLLLAFALVVTAASHAAPLAAQLRPITRPEILSDGPSHAVTVNPFFLLAGWVSGEYEQRVNPSLTVGAGASYFKYDKDRYTNFEAKASLYPNEHAMRGFSVAGSIGITHLSYIDNDQPICPVGCDETRRTVSTPALGISLAYQWMLGRTGRTAVVAGIGGKRFLASKSTLVGTDVVIPTFRLGIGYAW